jgi:23S rRNA (guanosine2251-2'-O)-methyltransferase
MTKNQYIYGFQTIKEVLRHQSGVIHRLYVQQKKAGERVEQILHFAQAAKVPIQWLEKNQLDQLVGAGHHQGLVAECSKIPALTEPALASFLEDIDKSVFFLILDGVTDPHNLGACMRTANAMGVDAVIVPKDRSVGLTEVVHKVSCGATAVTPLIQVTNLARSLKQMKEQGVWIAGLEAEAEIELDELNAGNRVALVMGSEGEGMRRLTKEQCDYLVKIPMFGTVESLNVSVAAAITLYTLRKSIK